MVSQERPFISQLIKNKLDFKTWALGCLKDSLKTLVGHTYLHIFRFIMHLFGWHVIQYRISLTDSIWSPTEGPSNPIMES
jgi:hypothetical protein